MFFNRRSAIILGMSISAFTLFRVVLSLVGIFAGAVVVIGMLRSMPLNGWVAIFLATTVLTSATGFLFPRDKLLPPHIVGILSLAVLALAILGFYVYRLAGSWRWIYVVSAVAALYFNVLVGVVQAFDKVSFLHAYAPTQSEPPFIVAQAIAVKPYMLIAYKTRPNPLPASAVFPWFASARDWITAVAHVVFGVALAGAYRVTAGSGPGR